jgi:Fe-S oxidoreductase
MISKGLLSEARQAAAGNVAVLAPLAKQGLPIIGLEPSCLLTLRDEYLDLLPGNPKAQTVARTSFLIEEFIAAKADRFRPLFSQAKAQTLLVHGHCYQKALTGTAALQTMLGLPGWQVSEINSGCCGLAGSFGYEAEHYEVSMAVGEDRLFPAIRAAGAGVGVAASGMSCRHQIQQGTGQAARHPIEWLADALP